MQRVPRAHINPPVPIRYAVTLMFIALSLVKPVLSQGGEADFSIVPNNIGFDWFDFGVLALVPSMDPMKLWYAVVAVGILFVLIPWLPPKSKGSPSRKPPSPCTRPTAVKQRFDETILDASLRQDVNIPYECRNGGCGVCKVHGAAGKVDPGLYQPNALSPEELAQGKVLACCATALEDCEIEYDASAVRTNIKEYTASVVDMRS